MSRWVVKVSIGIEHDNGDITTLVDCRNAIGKEDEDMQEIETASGGKIMFDAAETHDANMDRLTRLVSKTGSAAAQSVLLR